MEWEDRESFYTVFYDFFLPWMALSSVRTLTTITFPLLPHEQVHPILFVSISARKNDVISDEDDAGPNV